MSADDVEYRKVILTIQVEICAEKTKADNKVVFFGRESEVETRICENSVILAPEDDIARFVAGASDDLSSIICNRLEAYTR